MRNHITLYSTSHCHLCEQAEAMLATLSMTHGLSWRIIEITEDADLLARFELKIPVLERKNTGKLLCWPFTLEEIVDLINQGQ
ncbi:MAG: glutaredoxin family protein [Methylotenera sp.]|nr:glutaredoxin family protein [Methylotenera sp.]